MNISIAMATYNGEKFLQQQLDSLAAQAHLPLELVVGDDGSTDGTLDVLERFAKTAPFPVYIQRNPQNLGYGENFLQVASRCKGDWIAFCDQDDIWLPRKLMKATEDIRRNPDIKLWVHDMTAWYYATSRKHGHASGIRISKKIAPLKGPPATGYAGCAMIFHRSLLDIIDWRNRPKLYAWEDRPLVHDFWINLVAYCTAFRYHSASSLSLWRRHEDAVTAVYDHGLRVRLSRVSSTTAQSLRVLRAESLALAAWCSDVQTRSDPALAPNFRKAAALFASRARICEMRVALYEAPTMSRAGATFFRLLRERDYRTTFTTRQQIKDLLRLAYNLWSVPSSVERTIE